MNAHHCPAGHEPHPNGARWRCNLITGHTGLHDDGHGVTWADDTTTAGPTRLQTAAVNLIGSSDAWSALFSKVHDQVQAEGREQGVDRIVCKELADTAVFAVHAVLKGWAAELEQAEVGS